MGLKKKRIEMANKEPKTKKEKNLTEEAFKDPVRAVDEALGGKGKKGLKK
jgi:hypothetical protein